jgi:DNA-binding NtrC family response regulator
VLESALLSRDGGSVYVSAIERMPAPLQSRLTRALTSDRTDQSAAHPRCLPPAKANPADSAAIGLLLRELYDVPLGDHGAPAAAAGAAR